MEPCFTDTSPGGCVDYHHRMVTSPLTPLVILFLYSNLCKWSLPSYMIIPYALGRIITALATSAAVEVNYATPFLAVAYGWGWVTYSRKYGGPMKNAMVLMGGTVAVNLMVRATWYYLTDVENLNLNLTDVENVLFQKALPCIYMVACLLSWISLAKHENWYWFFGLAWGIVVPCILPMFGVTPYSSMTFLQSSFPYLRGPVLWYSDACVTLPLAVFGQLCASMKGKPDGLEDGVKKD